MELVKKFLLLSCVVTLTQAQEFESFVQERLESSVSLQKSILELQQSKLDAKIATRYKNPTLSLEVSDFNSNVSNDIGFRGAFAQPLRLWGVGTAMKQLSSAKEQKAQIETQMSRADFLSGLYKLYSDYKYASDAKVLVEEELEIAQNISEISKERFESGTIAKVKYLQASLDVRRLKNALALAEAKKTTAYYALLSFSGSDDGVSIESDFEVQLLAKSAQNLQVALSQKSLQQAEAETSLNAHRVSWIEAYAEFEKEPEQSIARVGLDIPLALFNSKSEERQIAQLEAKKATLESEYIEKRVALRLKELEASIKTLRFVEQSSQELLLSQEELLTIYEESYKSASIDFVELQLIKNQLIQTKEKLLEIHLQKAYKIIEHNYLSGAYNE